MNWWLFFLACYAIWAGRALWKEHAQSRREAKLEAKRAAARHALEVVQYVGKLRGTLTACHEFIVAYTATDDKKAQNLIKIIEGLVPSLKLERHNELY